MPSQDEDIYTRAVRAVFSGCIGSGVVLVLLSLAVADLPASVMITGICLMVSPCAFSLVGLVLLLGVTRPVAFSLVLFVIFNLVNIGKECAFMLFFLPFSLVWSQAVCFCAAWVVTRCKIRYFKKNAVLVQVKFHSRQRTVHQNTYGEIGYTYIWTGDYEVPLLSHDVGVNTNSLFKKPSHSAQEDSAEVCYHVQQVRKAFTVSIDYYQEDEMQAYVLPTRPKEAMLVQPADTEQAVIACFASGFVVGFAFPGLVIPLQAFIGAGGDPEIICTEWSAMVSYCLLALVVFMANIMFHVYRYQRSKNNDSETAVVVNGEQELPEIFDDETVCTDATTIRSIFTDSDQSASMGGKPKASRLNRDHSEFV